MSVATAIDPASLFVGVNFMTPHVLEYGWVTPDMAYELAEGLGFDNEPIFGVSLRPIDPSVPLAYEGDMFHTIEEARAYLEEVEEVG